MKKILFIFALLIFSFPASYIFAVPAESVMDPMKSEGLFVADEAQVLGPEYISLINGISKELKSKTGAELAVVTVGNLNGTTVEDYAVRLFSRFGIGQKGKNNGLLILFARDDRKVRIEAGYGLEPIINDAKAGRLLDTYAVPKFKDGLFGRGLYDVTKETALEIAKSYGVSLQVSDPVSWPAQPQIKIAPIQQESGPKIKNVSRAVLLYVIVVSAIIIFWLGIQTLSVFLNKAKAAKEQAIRSRMFLPTVIMIVGAIGMFLIAGAAEKIFLPLLGYFGMVFAGLGLQAFLHRQLEKYISLYHLICPNCESEMDMVDEISDNKFLKVEEMAEEQAKGMDYEFWNCPKCGHIERFDVKLHGAGKCPECGRRSLLTTKTTLVAATTSTSGKERIDYDCKNPKCGHHFEKIRTIPKISSSSSGGSGGSSGGSSFGGGSSGGGGASRGW
jgi:uncharacterized protein